MSGEFSSDVDVASGWNWLKSIGLVTPGVDEELSGLLLFGPRAAEGELVTWLTTELQIESMRLEDALSFLGPSLMLLPRRALIASRSFDVPVLESIAERTASFAADWLGALAIAATCDGVRGSCAEPGVTLAVAGLVGLVELVAFAGLAPFTGALNGLVTGLVAFAGLAPVSPGALNGLVTGLVGSAADGAPLPHVQALASGADPAAAAGPAALEVKAGLAAGFIAALHPSAAEVKAGFDGLELIAGLAPSAAEVKAGFEPDAVAADGSVGLVVGLLAGEPWPAPPRKNDRRACSAVSTFCPSVVIRFWKSFRGELEPEGIGSPPLAGVAMPATEGSATGGTAAAAGAPAPGAGPSASEEGVVGGGMTPVLEGVDTPEPPLSSWTRFSSALEIALNSLCKENPEPLASVEPAGTLELMELVELAIGAAPG